GQRNYVRALRISGPPGWNPAGFSPGLAVKKSRSNCCGKQLAAFPTSIGQIMRRRGCRPTDPQGALRTWYALAERFPDQPSATAALKTAVAAAERSAGATAPGNRSSDTNAEGLAVRLFRRSRRPNGRIS